MIHHPQGLSRQRYARLRSSYSGTGPDALTVTAAHESTNRDKSGTKDQSLHKPAGSRDDSAGHVDDVPRRQDRSSPPREELLDRGSPFDCAYSLPDSVTSNITLYPPKLREKPK